MHGMHTRCIIYNESFCCEFFNIVVFTAWRVGYGGLRQMLSGIQQWRKMKWAQKYTTHTNEISIHGGRKNMLYNFLQRY